MKIDKQTFDLDEELSISINFEDNDGLVFIPKNVSVEIKIVNYFGKIVINNLSIKHLEDELSLSKVGLEQNPVSYTHLRAHETTEHLVCRTTN